MIFDPSAFRSINFLNSDNIIFLVIFLIVLLIIIFICIIIVFEVIKFVKKSIIIIFNIDRLRQSQDIKVANEVNNLPKQKLWENATATEKLKTERWVTEQKSHQEGDLQKLQEDPEFFCWALSKAEDAEY